MEELADGLVCTNPVHGWYVTEFHYQDGDVGAYDDIHVAPLWTRFITGAAGLVDYLRSNLNTATACPVTQDKAVVERCNAGYNITPTLVLIRELYSV